jgi:hypothetical protein
LLRRISRVIAFGMPGPIHQSLLYLLKHNARLVFELARRFDARIVDNHRGYAVAANELPHPADPDSVTYADWVVATIATPRPRKHEAGVAVEVQTHEDPLKFYSWLGYAAGVRRVFECPGWTIVFAPDPYVRRQCQKMFVNESRASPWFVEPNMLPPILEAERAAADIDRAVLTSVFHIRSPVGLACALATLQALRVASKHAPVYRHLMRASMTAKQIRQTPKELLQWDEEDPLGPMEMTGAYYVWGRRKGREEGREEGRLAERRRVVLSVLAGRDLTINDEQRERIESCQDLDQLQRWLDRALIVAEPAALFE